MASSRARGLFCNRTLNLRAIRAVGYDMDYTLVHYHIDAWERRAYAYLREGLADRGFPVAELELVPGLVTRGLILDTELGNVVKANRFGYVKRAFHGTRLMSFEDQRAAYARTLVDLREDRWVFLNTFFSISEACMYMQLVDLADAGALGRVLGYAELHGKVRAGLDAAHAEGRLKAEIVADPGRFVERDPEMPLTLLDQKEAGKQVLLITNSEWDYAAPLLAYAFDGFLPGGKTWRDVFDVAIVGARKPDFFSGHAPAFEVVSDDGLLREHRGALGPGVYVGGNAALVESSLGLAGEEILYVGDHVFTDVNVSKNVNRWRTALVIRELEDEIAALEAFAPDQDRLAALMAEKTALEAEHDAARLALQRVRRGYGPAAAASAQGLDRTLTDLRTRLADLDARIAPLAKASAELLEPHWGLLMRAGNDKSHFARQVERYADIYTSRVSNLLAATPFAYLRSPRGSLPHDGGWEPVAPVEPVR